MANPQNCASAKTERMSKPLFWSASLRQASGAATRTDPYVSAEKKRSLLYSHSARVAGVRRIGPQRGTVTPGTFRRPLSRQKTQIREARCHPPDRGRASPRG